MGETKSTFKTLAAVNVKDRVEKKGRFDYLSWAYAWAMIKDQYPDANRKVYESESSSFNTLYNSLGFYTAWNILPEDLQQFDFEQDHNNRYIMMVDALKWLDRQM